MFVDRIFNMHAEALSTVQALNGFTKIFFYFLLIQITWSTLCKYHNQGRTQGYVINCSRYHIIWCFFIRSWRMFLHLFKLHFNSKTRACLWSGGFVGSPWSLRSQEKLEEFCRGCSEFWLFQNCCYGVSIVW